MSADSYDLQAAGLLSSMISLRTELARGDRGALYLAWLAGVSHGHLDDDALEPPVLAGLGELTGSLAALADFIRVDPDLLEIAAQASAPRDTVPLQSDEVRAWVGTLPADEKDDLLTHLVVAPDDVASLSTELQCRFGKARDSARPGSSGSHEPRRTVGELLRATEERAAQREQEAARKAAEAKTRRERETAAARVQHLDRLAGHETRLWADVERLAATKLPKSYDQVVIHLVDLRDLAARKGRGSSTDFATRLEHFRAAHARKPSLLDRLNRGGL